MVVTCKYFGARTSKQEITPECQACKKQVDVFKKCTYETNVLMSTSIEIDKHGKTVTVPPTGRVPDDKLIVEL